MTETDATRNKNVVQVCLDRIDEARPFFLCFLGQRYGWVPKDDEIAPETFENFAGLGRAVQENASVTEMEVLHALLREPFDQDAGKRLPTEHAFFYLREPGYLMDLPSDPPELQRTYSDEAEPDAVNPAFLLDKQRQLRTTVIEKTARPARSYAGHWNPDARTPELALPLVCPSSDKKNRERWRKQWKDSAGVETTDETVAAADRDRALAFNDRLCAGRLETFGCDGRALGEVIIEDLKNAILARYPEHKELPEQDELEHEIDRHEDFTRTATDVFIERSGDFAELDAYVTGNSQKLFVLVAKAGLGKSTLLANWVARFREREGKPADETLHARFVGVGEQSSTVDALLRSILAELRNAGKLASETPDNSNLLRSKFAELLGECGKKGRTVVVIDALNQLQSGLSDLDWLARTLPENVKVVVSFKLGDDQGDALAAAMRSDESVIVSEVQPFSHLQRRRDLVAAYLRQYLKELDEKHLEALIQAEGAENPLFLKVVLTELRVFGAFARLGELIKSEFGATPQSAFDAVLRRLENDPSYAVVPSQQVVPLLFGLLAHSSGGLPEDLLVQMFLDELGVGENRHEDVRGAIRVLFRQVRPFLARRDGRTDFFYEAFQAAARERYTEGVVAASNTPAESGGVVSNSISPSGQSLGLWRRLLARVHGMQPDTARITDSISGESTNPASVARRLRSKSQWHTLLARACERWSELESAARRYSLGNLVHHAVEAGNSTAAEVITNFGYHYERLRALGREEVVNVTMDFMLTEPIANFSAATRERFDIWRAFYAEHSHILTRDDAHILAEVSLLQLAVAHAKSSPVTASAEHWFGTAGSDLHWLRTFVRPAAPPRSDCLRTLDGHTWGVQDLALFPDGLRAISASGDGTLKIWNLDTGRCLRTIQGDEHGVAAVALLPDSRRAISGGLDATLKVWDLDTGQCLQTLQGHTNQVSALSVSFDGQHALSTSAGATAKLWNLNTGGCLKTLQTPLSNGHTVALLPDGRRALLVNSDYVLELWDLETEQRHRTFPGHTNAIALFPSGHQVIAGNADSRARVWDLDTGQCLHTLEGHVSPVCAVTVSSNGRYALSAGFHELLRLWDLQNGTCLRTLLGHRSLETALAFLPGARRAVSASSDHSLKVWDLTSSRSTEKGHASAVSAIALSSDGRYALIGDEGHTLTLYALDTGQPLRIFEGHTSTVDCVVFLSDGQRALSGSWDHTLRLWNLQTGECTRQFAGHTDMVNAIDVSHDGQRALSASQDSTLKVWSLETGECLRTLQGHAGAVRAAAFLSGGHRAVSASNDRTLKVWDLETGECLQVLQGHRDAVWAIALLPGGDRVLSASLDKLVKLWNVVTGQCIRTFEGHSNCVGLVAPLPDGCCAMSAGGGGLFPSDNSVRIWNITTGQCLRTLRGHMAPIRALTSFHGGRLVVTGSEDKTAKVWDVETAKCLATWQAKGQVTRCAVGASEAIVAGTDAGEVLHFTLISPERISTKYATTDSK